MSASTALYITAPSLILLAGVIDDLRSKKIHNVLVVAMLALSIPTIWITLGWSHLQQGLVAMAAALILCLPLVLARGLGAGDMKLLMAASVFFVWSDVLWVFLYSLIWGTLLGLFKALFSGQLKSTLIQALALTTKNRPPHKDLLKIPYSVALLFGWFTHLSLLQAGGGL